MTSRFDLSAELSQLKSFDSSLPDDDEVKEITLKLIDVLENLQTSLLEVDPPVSHTLFSDVDFSTLYATGICHDCKLVLSVDEMDQIEASGKADDLTTTTELINLVRNHVWLETEVKSGCMMINIILLHIAKAMHSQTSEVVIMPQFPIEQTTFKMKDSRMHSFSGVVDDLLAYVPPGHFCNLLHKCPDFVLGSPNKYNTPVVLVIGARKDKVIKALAQSAITAASYCKAKKLSVLRGCMTSGEEWAFFVYKSPTASGDRELFSSSEAISLGPKLERLPLILGLLKDMVANTFNFEQKYFSYHH